MIGRKQKVGPDAGEIYTFETSPWDNSSLRKTNRYAALKVLLVNHEIVVVAVLDGIWSQPPSLEEAEACAILREHRFSFTGEAAVFGLVQGWWCPKDLKNLQLLGRSRVTSDESEQAQANVEHASGSRFGPLGTASKAAEGEWCWMNNRDEMIREQAKRKADADALHKIQEQRHRNRMDNLTWDQLLAEIPLQRWSPSPPFPSAAFTDAARKTIVETCLELSALGSTPRKSDVRAILKRCVEWFNVADNAAGGVIETEEREDICAMLEEMAVASNQRGLVPEIDDWREW